MVYPHKIRYIYIWLLRNRWHYQILHSNTIIGLFRTFRIINFLEEMGYSVFYKNINLNYFVGKVRWRPWAEIGGRIATNTTTFNRELLIVEKENDGKPFDLHTSYEDRANYYSNLRNPWLLLMLMLVAFATVNRSVILGIVAVIFLIPVIIYQLQIMKNRHEAKMKEW